MKRNYADSCPVVWLVCRGPDVWATVYSVFGMVKGYKIYTNNLMVLNIKTFTVFQTM